VEEEEGEVTMALDMLLPANMALVWANPHMAALEMCHRALQVRLPLPNRQLRPRIDTTQAL